MLRGPLFVSPFRGVFIPADIELTHGVLVRAASLVLPPDAAASHETALRLMGVEVGSELPLHFSTNSSLRCRHPGIVLHRRQGRLSPRPVGGVRVLGPDRSFVDCATTLSFVRLVQAGDWLVHLGLTSLDTLAAYVNASHLDGVVRGRRTYGHVRSGVESPMETLVRLVLILARLPEPATNVDIVDEDGRFVARGDMSYLRYKVLVEYDGRHHERDARQRQYDHLRLERLQHAGWIVVVITAEDLRDKRRIAWRVFDALRVRGYAGRPPHFNAMWTRWFG